MFVTKEAVSKFWCLHIICLSTRKQFKTCGVCIMYLSTRGQLQVVVSAWRVCQQEDSLQVVQFKRCGVNASCVCQQGSSLQVLVFMHYPFVTKEAV